MAGCRWIRGWRFPVAAAAAVAAGVADQAAAAAAALIITIMARLANGADRAARARMAALAVSAAAEGPVGVPLKYALAGGLSWLANCSPVASSVVVATQEV